MSLSRKNRPLTFVISEILGLYDGGKGEEEEDRKDGKGNDKRIRGREVNGKGGNGRTEEREGGREGQGQFNR